MIRLSMPTCSECGDGMSHDCNDCLMPLCANCMFKVVSTDCGDLYHDDCNTDTFHKHFACPALDKDYDFHCDGSNYNSNHSSQKCYHCGKDICGYKTKIFRDKNGNVECNVCHAYYFNRNNNTSNPEVKMQDVKPICECGQDAVDPRSSARQHSSWCPKSKS